MHKQARRVFDEVYKTFRETGTTYTEERDLALATHLNPTFHHSRHGPASVVHPCVDPLTPFHPAPLFGDGDPAAVTAANLVEAVRKEFGDWCNCLHLALTRRDGRITLRLLLGDPLVVASALEEFGRAQALDLHTPVGSWSMHPMMLSEEEYVHDGAPTTFEVIDTATLWDTVGMFNLLASTTPLLSLSSNCDSVLYTESLIAWQHNEKTNVPGYRFEQFTEVALWFDLCPVDYLTGFTSRYNAHETLTFSDRTHTRRHEILVWKRPSSGDRVARQYPPPNIAFQEPAQLASRLQEVYTRMFGDMLWSFCLTVHLDSWRRESDIPEFLLYTRETFARFLRCVKDRFCDSEDYWNEVMTTILAPRRGMKFDLLSEVEFFAQLHRLGVCSIEGINDFGRPSTGRISQWETIPPLVRVTVIVPRAHLRDRDFSPIVSHVGNSPLAISMTGILRLSWYQCINATFGRATDIGTDSAPRIQVDEDPDGIRGASDLILSFVICTAILMEPDLQMERPQPFIEVFLLVAPGKALLTPDDGDPTIRINLFEVHFEDRQSVIVTPEECLPSAFSPSPCAWLSRHRPPQQAVPGQLAIGKQLFVRVKMEIDEDDDEPYEKITGFTAGIEVDNPDVRAGIASDPSMTATLITQASPCSLRVSLAGHEQVVVFPLPVSASKSKVQSSSMANDITFEVSRHIQRPYIYADLPDGTTSCSRL